MEVLTERLLLRTWRQGDAGLLGEIYGQPEYLETMRPANAAEQIACSCRRWEEDGFSIDTWRSHLTDACLCSFTAPDNRRSCAVIERLGMKHGESALWKGLEHVWYVLEREAP